MKNFYRVTLYEIEKYKQVKEVGVIIVENGIFTAKEVMTNQKFRIYSDTEYVSAPEIGRKNLFLVSKDFSDENIVTGAELRNYIDSFKPGVYPYSEVIKAKKNRLILKKSLR